MRFVNFSHAVRHELLPTAADCWNRKILRRSVVLGLIAFVNIAHAQFALPDAFKKKLEDATKGAKQGTANTPSVPSVPTIETGTAGSSERNARKVQGCSDGFVKKIEFDEHHFDRGRWNGPDGQLSHEICFSSQNIQYVSEWDLKGIRLGKLNASAILEKCKLARPAEMLNFLVAESDKAGLKRNDRKYSRRYLNALATMGSNIS